MEALNRTKIEYLDYDLNIITGCSGEGCAVRKHCWALSMAKRLRGRYGYPKDEPFKPTFHEDKLDEPFKVKKPSLIGLCFMGDFYDKQVHPTWQIRTYSMINRAYWHTFLILTKQPQNIPNRGYPSNLQLGVSVNCKRDLWRIDELKKKDVRVRVGSFEPLLEDLGKINLEGIGWVIIGAQTRPELQPEPDWVWKIVFEASSHNIPIFIKNNLKHYNPIQQFPEVQP